MNDAQEDFEAVLKTLGQAKLLLAGGRQIEDVCEQLGVPKDAIQAWADRLSLPGNPSDIPSSCRILDAVFPYLHHRGTERTTRPHRMWHRILDWRQIADPTAQQLASQGMKSVYVEIDPETFPAWRSEHRSTRINKDARMAFGNAKALESLRQGV